MWASKIRQAGRNLSFLVKAQNYIIQSLIHSAVCPGTGSQPLPKRIHHTARSSASCFNFQCPLDSLSPSNSCLHLLPRLPVPSVFPSIFPSVTSFRRHFLRRMWPIQLVRIRFTVCTMFYSRITSSCFTRSVQLIFSILLQHHISRLSGYFLPTFRSAQVSAQFTATLQM